MKFEELSLHPEIVAALDQLKISECTDIQRDTIPLILDGKDISGLSQTGTGKTFAFAIPLIDRILRTREITEASPEIDQKRKFDSWNSGNFVLVLVPTRELADQINKSILSVSKSIKTAVVYGGVEYEKQIELLKNGVDFVVGTPGRLIDLYKNHLVNFRHAKAIVFDEADRMFDMGFKEDMAYVLERAPSDRQILLFSATLNFDVLNTIYRFGANPVEINVSRDQVKAGEVKDELYHVGEKEKPQFLLSLITRQKPKQTIIFTNYKNNVDRITQFLNSNGVPAVGISSLLTQNQRERVLEQFKNENERNTLVATDVAARGLDVKGVDLVINYDLPDDAENYVHRIGRTGRAGEKGEAFSMVSDRDVQALSRIEGYLKTKVTIGWLEDSDLIKEYKPLPHGEFRGESRVKKTGLAAMKSQGPNSGGGDRNSGNRNNRHQNSNKRFDSNRPPRDNNRPPRDGDRPPREGDRPQGDRPPRHQNANNGSGGQHRDRKMGRHGGATDSRPPRNDQQQNQNRHAKPHAQNKVQGPRPQQKSFRQNKGSSSPSQKAGSFRKGQPNNAAPKSSSDLSGKLKKFIKGLFR